MPVIYKGESVSASRMTRELILGSKWGTIQFPIHCCTLQVCWLHQGRTLTVEISPQSALVTKLAFSVSIGWQPIVGGGVNQWEAWNWSCDFRANERPKKISPDGADTHAYGHGDSMINSAQRMNKKAINTLCCLIPTQERWKRPLRLCMGSSSKSGSWWVLMAFLFFHPFTSVWPQQTVRSSCLSSMSNEIRPEPTNKRFNSAYLQIKYLIFVEKFTVAAGNRR